MEKKEYLGHHSNRVEEMPGSKVTSRFLRLLPHLKNQGTNNLPDPGRNSFSFALLDLMVRLPAVPRVC